MKKLKSVRGIPLSYIQSVLKIDSNSPTGLTWLHRKDVPNEWNTRFANKYAGSENGTRDRYRRWDLQITYNRKIYRLKCSRIIFLLHKGYLTKGKCIDHIDNNPLNNNPKNLRESTDSENAHNSKLPKNNTSGHKGVSWFAPYSKWIVRIKKNSKEHFFGYYEKLEDAIKVAIAARKKLHGDFGRNQ